MVKKIGRVIGGGNPRRLKGHIALLARKESPGNVTDLRGGSIFWEMALQYLFAMILGWYIHPSAYASGRSIGWF